MALISVPIPKLDVSEAPRTDVSSAAFVRPNIGEGLQELGQGAGDLASSLARQQAQSDLQNQKVTIDPTGQVQMATPDNSVILGRAGEEYNQAIAAGHTAQLSSQVRARLQDLQLQFPDDPAGFQHAAGTYVDSVRANTTLGPEVGNALGTIASNEAESRLANVKEKSFEIGAKQALGNVQAEIGDTQNRMRAIAQQGGIGTPEYAQLQATLGQQYDNLKSSGRIFGYAPDRADSELANSLSMDKGEAIVANVDKTFNRTGGDGGRAGAQKYLETLDDPALNLSMQERDHFKAYGLAHLEYLASNQKAQIDASRVGSNSMLDLYRTDPTKVTEQMFGQAKTAAQQVGDAESVMKLQWAHDTAPTVQALQKLPDEQRIQAMAGMAAGSSGSEKQALDYFTSQGWTPAQAAGIVGNLSRESRLNPGASNPGDGSDGSDSIGIGQWNSGRAANLKAFAASQGKPFTDFQTQLAFVQHELTTSEGNAATMLKGATTPQAAAAAFALGYERPAGFMTGDINQVAGGTDRVNNAVRIAGGNASSTPIYSGPAARQAPTAAQMAANPYALPMYIQSLKADSESEIKTARNVGTAIDQQFSQGTIPPPLTTAAFLQVAAKHPELGDIAQKVTNYYQGATEGGYANTLPEAQRQAYAAQVASALANPTDLNSMGRAEEVQRVMKKGAENLQQDPFPEMLRRHWIGAVPTPIDFSQPQTLSQAIIDRGQAALKRASFTGTPDTPIFAPAEATQISDAMKYAPLDGRLSLLSSITNARLPQPILEATLKQLGSDDATRPLAVAGDVARYNPIVARGILQGQALMQTDKDLAPNKDDFPTAFAKALPFNDLGGDARKGLDSAIQALYATRSAAVNDTGGALNQGRLDDVIRDVTGGVVEWRGGKAIAPWYGAGQEGFEAALGTVTDKDLANSRGSDGIPLPASALKPSVAGIFSDGSRWRLQSYGDGKYMVYSGPDDGRQYLRDTTGKNFVLDLGAKRAQAEAASLAMPSSLFHNDAADADLFMPPYASSLTSGMRGGAR